MINLDKKYPKYRWNRNFGYGTADHLRGLKKYGVTKHHRKKFKPVHNMLMRYKRETLFLLYLNLAKPLASTLLAGISLMAASPNMLSVGRNC